MVRLNNPKRKLLTWDDFEKYPTWTWDDENESHLPISEKDPAPEDYSGLLIRANFITPNGISFNGYLVGDYHFHAFFLFLNKDDDVGFNVNMSSFVERKIDKIFVFLKSQPFPVFPLRYHSDITYSDGGKISGVFEFKNGKLTCTPDNWEERWEKLKREAEKKYGKID